MELRLHPVVRLFPRMTEEEFTALVEDIKEHGQREPVLIYNGRIIDGRHRWLACEQLEIECEVEEWDGEGSFVDAVVSRNLLRRSLDVSQRAVVAAEILPYKEKEARARQKDAGANGKKGGRPRKGDHPENPVRPVAQRVSESEEEDQDERPQAKRAVDEAGKIAGVSGRTVARVKAIKKAAKELVPLMRDGHLTVREGERLAKLSEDDRAAVLVRAKALAKEEHDSPYRDALKEHKPKCKPQEEPEKLLKRKLAQAVRQVEALDDTLKGLVKTAKDLDKHPLRGREVRRLVQVAARVATKVDKLTPR